MKPLDALSADEFNDCLHQSFHIQAGDETIAAELVEVRSLKSHTRRQDRNPFSILFQGPIDKPLEQRIYRLTSDTMGELDLFLVTLGPDADGTGMTYEAVFT